MKSKDAAKDLDGQWQRVAVRRTVLVNLRSDKAFRGILWAQDGPLLVLKNAELLEPGHEARRVDGEVVIERRNVDFVQVLPTPEG